MVLCLLVLRCACVSPCNRFNGFKLFWNLGRLRVVEKNRQTNGVKNNIDPILGTAVFTFHSNFKVCVVLFRYADYEFDFYR